MSLCLSRLLVLLFCLSLSLFSAVQELISRPYDRNLVNSSRLVNPEKAPLFTNPNSRVFCHWRDARGGGGEGAGPVMRGQGGAVREAEITQLTGNRGGLQGELVVYRENSCLVDAGGLWRLYGEWWFIGGIVVYRI